MTELSTAQVNPLLPTVRAGKSKEQYYAEIKAKRTHTCLHCKKEYVSKRRQLNEGIKFCSRECAFGHKKENAKLEYSRLVLNECEVCSNKRLAKRKAKYCSLECRSALARRRAVERYRSKEAADHEIVKCAQCAILFKPDHGNAIYCSTKCATRAGRKGRGSNTERAKRFGVDRGYFNERRILVRDKWTCRLCGVKTPERLRGKNLHNSPEVDHITPLSQGGVHRQHNLQCTCRRCNLAKGSSPLGQLIIEGFADIK